MMVKMRSLKKFDNMKEIGFFKGMTYGDDCKEEFSDYEKIKNELPRETILEYLKAQPIACYGMFDTMDIFTGERLEPCGLIEDGNFLLPYDFIHYYEKYNIGIPKDYEEYIKSQI